MPGSIRALRRQADPIRGRGRIPLTKARSKGRPQFRPTGTNTLSEQEQAIADSIETAFLKITANDLLDSLERRDAAGFAKIVLARLAEAAPHIERTLLDSLIQSGETSAIDLGRELSSQYRRVGKADAPLPSSAALQFRFNTADPRATAWASAESGRLITNMAASQQEMFRALVTQSFIEAGTMGTTASSIFQQLQTVTPTPTARNFAESIGSNLNGLTERYERAVMNRVADLGDDLAKRGITGTRALEQMRKEGDKYAKKLRRARSRTIARTERMMAHNQAQLLSYQQAIDSGLMSREHSRKVWSTGPFDVCPICVAMSGVEAKIADAFTLPNGTQVQAPPGHPNCRCTLQSRTDVDLFDPPRNLGTGQPGDPFRVSPRVYSAEGERLTGLTPPPPVPTPTPAPAAQTPPTVPAVEPAPPTLPTRPAPSAPAGRPQITGVNGPPGQDDLAFLQKYGRGAGTENVARAPKEVSDVFDRKYKQALIDLGEEPDIGARGLTDKRRAWIDQRNALREQFLDEPEVRAWADEMNAVFREAFPNFGQVGRLGRADGSEYFSMRETYAKARHARTATDAAERATLISDPNKLRYVGRTVSDTEVLAAYESKVDEFVDWIKESDLAIQIEPRSLSKVMKDGRFKSQFETGTSGGLKDLDVRRYEELRRFGVPVDADDTLRPIYGHIQNSSRVNTTVDQYGSARVVLKQEVKERATYTTQDSLASQDIPFPVTQPNSDYVRIDKWKWPPDYGQNYVETQIHGGLSIDDIAEVIFDTSAPSYKEPTKTLLKQLDDAAIPYRFVKRAGDSLDELQFVSV